MTDLGVKVSRILFTRVDSKSYCKPYALFVATITLVAIVFWFGWALPEVHPGRKEVTLQTGGWFYLGFPFVLGIAFSCALGVTLAARKAGQVWVWLTLLPLSAFLAYGGATRDFPQHRLPVILGIDSTAITILTYRVVDSFNDGDMTFGTLEVSPEEFDAIVKNRDLTPRSDMSRPMLAEDRYPDGLPTASNDRLTVWYDAKEHRMYFQYHSRRNRGGRSG